MKKSGSAFSTIETSAKIISGLQYKDRIIVKTILNVITGQLTTKDVSTQMAFNISTMEFCFVCPQKLFDKIDALIKKENNQ